jgi:hypothetical protein
MATVSALATLFTGRVAIASPKSHATAGTLNLFKVFAAQWLACKLSCQRSVSHLAIHFASILDLGPIVSVHATW